MLLLQAPSAAPTPYSHYNQFTKYDRHFSKYSKRYFGAGFDWRYFKAQAIAESGLQADARSRVGAVGLMQVMPRTFEDIRQQNPEITGGWISPLDIAAGIWYDRRNFVIWRASRPFEDKLKFMFASYNAGRGNVLAGPAACARRRTRWEAMGVDPESASRRDGEDIAERPSAMSTASSR